MMDLKEIIKWFIPCFHILRVRKIRLDTYLTCICLFLLFNIQLGFTTKVDSLDINTYNKTKNIDIRPLYDIKNDQSDNNINTTEKGRSFEDSSVGRTFGRPFKKMAQALIPLVFHIGAASTWAVVAALVGVKTLVVTLIILKLLLVAGAAKIGALFGSKGHQDHGWSTQYPQQKEIHLHIHKDTLEAHDAYGASGANAWNRDGADAAQQSVVSNVVIDTYAGGPQTISTPYGNYMKIEPQNPLTASYYR